MNYLGFSAYKKREKTQSKQLRLNLMNEIRKEMRVGPIKSLPRRKDSWMETQIDRRMPSLPSGQVEYVFAYQFIYPNNSKVKDIREGTRRAFVRDLFHIVIEQDLFRKILCVHWNSLSLREYVQYAAHRDSVLRVIHERKPLFPLLRYIPSEKWGLSDCLSRKNITDFDDEDKSAESSADVLTPAGYKWLHSASVAITSSKLLSRSPTIANRMGLVKIQDHIPVALWKKLIQLDHRFRGMRGNKQHDALLVRFYELFAKHAIQIRSCDGYQKYKKFVYLSQWDDDPMDFELVDWLRQQGLSEGFPKKNSTWNSLIKQSDSWHREIQMKKLGTDFSWDDEMGLLLTETINNLHVKPLLSLYALFDEGRDMHHCVASFAQDCQNGVYRVFSLTSVDDATQRSTLGIFKERGHWYIDQHKGYCNAKVNDAHAKAGIQICKLYDMNKGTK